MITLGLLNTIVHLMLIIPKWEANYVFENNVPIISTENNIGTNTYFSFKHSFKIS